MSRESLIELVRGELPKLPPDRRLEFKRDHALIACPYHAGGQERTPSFKIDMDAAGTVPIGWCWCWGCKQSMPWNDFAELFGLARFRKGQIKAAGDPDAYLRRYNFSCEEVQVPDLNHLTKWPLSVEWRGIPGKTLSRYEARSITFGKQPFLYLPVLVHREQVGGINCRVVRNRSNKEEKAYINTGGTWAESALFGFDVARQQPELPLWVVEGPRDAAWVRACGSRVVGLIGSAVTVQKIRLIRDLDPPSILIATDPDEAGDGAAALLSEALAEDYPMLRLPMRRATAEVGAEDPAQLEPERVKRATARMLKRFG